MQENFGDVLSHLQELKEGQKELISGQNAIFGDTQEINEKLDMLIDASKLQYKKQQKIPKPSITDGVHRNENLVEIIPVFSTFSNFFKKKKKKL